MNSDGDKLYMKLVAFDEIYNFVVQTLFIWSHFETKKKIYCPYLSFRYPDMDNISIVWAPRWLQMKKKIELQSCRSHRKLQDSYKVYLYSSL
jgi:hypothetical protein